MKYVNTYTNTAGFESDKERLNSLDDIWAAFISDEQKTILKEMHKITMATYDFTGLSGSQRIIDNTNDLVESIRIVGNGVDQNLTLSEGVINVTLSTDGEYTVYFKFKQKDANLHDAFADTKIKSIANGFLNNFTDIIDIRGIFSSCDKLITVPEDIISKFTNLESVMGMFSMCTSLETIPEKIFINNTKLSNFTTCFYHCYNLTGNIPLYYNGKLLYESNAEGSSCFEGCTNLNGYENIPTYWGGPAATTKEIVIYPFARQTATDGRYLCLGLDPSSPNEITGEECVFIIKCTYGTEETQNSVTVVSLTQSSPIFECTNIPIIKNNNYISYLEITTLQNNYHIQNIKKYKLIYNLSLRKNSNNIWVEMSGLPYYLTMPIDVNREDPALDWSETNCQDNFSKSYEIEGRFTDTQSGRHFVYRGTNENFTGDYVLSYSSNFSLNKSSVIYSDIPEINVST